MTGLQGFDFDLDGEPAQDMSTFFSEDTPRTPLDNSQGRPAPPIAFKKSKWTSEEDEQLRQNVELHGLGNWSLIAQGLPGRNGKQCRERWMNQLCPALNKDNWAPQEDAVLVQQQRIYGNVWSRIAQFLPGRSPNAVKNRWSWLSRHAISSALAMRMMPILPQPHAPHPPPRIVLPEFARAQELTAPPDLQWPGGSPVIDEAAAPGPFSEPDLPHYFGFRTALSDVEAPVQLSDKLAKEGEDPFRPFEDWLF
jgi:hypothetical protein